MSKSVKRVRAALEAAGIAPEIKEMADGTRTAADAAAALGCTADQIAKSVIFRGQTSDNVYLFVTAGGRRVDPDKATKAAGETLGAADAAFIRQRTGFAIGGVAPLGHFTPPRAFFDPYLLEFDVVWAAAGTPRHVFPLPPATMAEILDAQISDFT